MNQPDAAPSPDFRYTGKNTADAMRGRKPLSQRISTTVRNVLLAAGIFTGAGAAHNLTGIEVPGPVPVGDIAGQVDAAIVAMPGTIVQVAENLMGQNSNAPSKEVVNPQAPRATDFYPGRTAEIHITEVSLANGNNDIWPHLRSDPFVNDFEAGNTIDWSNVTAVDNAPVDPAQDGTQIDIQNPAYVLGPNPDITDPHDPAFATRVPWGVLTITLRNGNTERAYYSLTSNQAAPYVVLNGTGESAPISQANGTANQVTLQRIVPNP
jgi:hypothetical protein